MMSHNLIELPPKLYEAIRKQAAARQKTPETLVVEWISQHVSLADENGEIMLAFEQEAEAFDRLKPMLLEKYAGHYVAVYQGQVVASGSDKFEVQQQVHDQFGEVPCFIERVEPDYEMRVARMPSLIG
jgi:hypothetical protein